MGPEGHKPDVMDNMDAKQFGDSMTRNEHLGMPKSTEHYLGNVETALDGYTEALHLVETAKEGEHPTEWKSDAERAKKIQSDIRQKLAELKGLFKLS
ncbi:MAG: hypothetical protein Q8L52_02690 [bacterium]|nr:hypothetical protein [bacterium]